METGITAPARPWSLTSRLEHLPAGLVVGLVIVLIVIVIAVLVPLLSPYNSTEIIASDSLLGPSARHWFGSDDLGRDVMVRVAEGYRISLSVAVGSVLIAVLGGIPLGLIAGYFEGVVGEVIMRPLDILMSFPAILLAVVVMAILGTGTAVVLLAIGIVYIPVIARIMRASTLGTKRELFIEAVRSRGASHFRLIALHILPNSVGPAIVQASILMGIAIILEAALSFIGLGVRPPTPSLGLMLASERDFMVQAPWVVAAPGLAIMLLVLGFNLIGDGLRDRLDPHGRSRLR
jgi:peptide/nickel transport system permease protein